MPPYTCFLLIGHRGLVVKLVITRDFERLKTNEKKRRKLWIFLGFFWDFSGTFPRLFRDLSGTCLGLVWDLSVHSGLKISRVPRSSRGRTIIFFGNLSKAPNAGLVNSNGSGLVA